jgi:zinc/manganese transport system substrate-binding protein
VAWTTWPRIDALNRQVREWLGAVPRAQRRVITSHDAFGYFGAAYGVDFLAAQGWNTHSEPSAAAVARLIRQIKKEGVRALFIENISDPRLVERIAREGGARIGGTLYSDALSKPDGPAATYLRMMEHNARSLAAALQA